MTTRTANTKGLARPSRGQSAKPGIGSGLTNARSINTEQGGHNPNVGRGGLPNSYFGNSKACGSTDRGKK